MRLFGWLALVLSTLALLLGNTPCGGTPTVPGTSAGTFAVTETMTANACAGGFDPDPLLRYTTDIRAEGDTAYWHRGDTPIASGTYTAAGHFHFVSQQDVPAYGPEAGGGPQGCSVRQTETIDGMLSLGAFDAGPSSDAGASSDASSPSDAALDAGPDAGVHATGFVGTDSIQISITPGSDCSLLFANNGGPFSTLPCTATYDMTATASGN
jgi:hypothetical protein